MLCIGQSSRPSPKVGIQHLSPLRSAIGSKGRGERTSAAWSPWKSSSAERVGQPCLSRVFSLIWSEHFWPMPWSPIDCEWKFLPLALLQEASSPSRGRNPLRYRGYLKHGLNYFKDCYAE